mmetsp:Transcript_27752/g.59322  ORF Transcript_27752/g.59322 Transcript_27752/m.59322 type:complete len:204 (-) Transcript_27752:484-1095(-)
MPAIHRIKLRGSCLLGKFEGDLAHRKFFHDSLFLSLFFHRFRLTIRCAFFAEGELRERNLGLRKFSDRSTLLSNSAWRKLTRFLYRICFTVLDSTRCSCALGADRELCEGNFGHGKFWFGKFSTSTCTLFVLFTGNLFDPSRGKLLLVIYRLGFPILDPARGSSALLFGSFRFRRFLGASLGELGHGKLWGRESGCRNLGHRK